MENIKVGDYITDEAVGASNAAGLTTQILGIATNILTSKVVSLSSPAANPADYDGTWDASTKTYTAAADNQTDKLVMVEYDEIHADDQIRTTLSANKGTTLGSNKIGYNLGINVSNSSQLDEATSSSSTTNTSFRIVNPLLDGPTNEVIVICTRIQNRI